MFFRDTTAAGAETVASPDSKGKGKAPAGDESMEVEDDDEDDDDDDGEEDEEDAEVRMQPRRVFLLHCHTRHTLDANEIRVFFSAILGTSH